MALRLSEGLGLAGVAVLLHDVDGLVVFVTCKL